jgi:hypothetical protein
MDSKTPLTPSSCPICHASLAITRLHCASCGTTIEGNFQSGGWAGLSSEQLSFLEVFIRCEGKLNRMEREVGLSYPTLRNRLAEIIRAMGFEPGANDLSEETRRKVLEEVAAGRLTAQDALRRLSSD